MKDVTDWKALSNERGILLREMSRHIEALEAALVDIRELVDGYEDVDDGQPNLAMRVMTTVDAALNDLAAGCAAF